MVQELVAHRTSRKLSACLTCFCCLTAALLAGCREETPPPTSATALVPAREAMVRGQLEARGIADERVLAAMRRVPRDQFVPLDQRPHAYEDRPLPIGEGQTISQPYIVAFMTELLEIEEGEKVLEIGTGSGYQAAMLTEFTPHVFTIEIVEPLARAAADRLKKRGYQTIKTKTADGYWGWKEHAPFDAVIVTCAADHIPPALIEQLKPTGKMCIPVGGPLQIQNLMLISKDKNGTITSRSLMPVRFVPLTRIK